MRLMRTLLLALVLCSPAVLYAALSKEDLPAAQWYAHVDLEAMRASDAGRQLYDWLDREVFQDLQDELGFDAEKEADSITAVATAKDTAMILIKGDFTQQTRDQVMAVAAAVGEFNALTYDGNDYYQIIEDDGQHRVNNFDVAAFMSMALEDTVVFTSTEAQMRQILDANGRLPGDYDSDGALVVLRGEKALVQAGLQTSAMDTDLGWDSNLLRNTEQLAFLISDQAGKLALEAQLLATDETIANSLASIVRGLISLQAFSEDIDPEVSAFLNSTEVEVDGSTLSLKLAMQADMLIDVID